MERLTPLEKAEREKAKDLLCGQPYVTLGLKNFKYYSQFITFLKDFGFTCERALDPRVKAFNWREPDTTFQLRQLTVDTSNRWHRDFKGIPMGPPASYLIVWSNTHGTQLQLKDGTIVDTPEGGVMLINNRKVEHRAKPGEPERGRYFTRYTMK